MATKAKDKPTAGPITAAQIEQYLTTQNDFDLELFAFRTLLERGIPAHHGGTYTDPVTGKARQYDLRATKILHSNTAISLAIECKSLTPEFPLIVSRVRRPTEDSYHELLDSQYRYVMVGGALPIRTASEFGRGLYQVDSMVGKGTAQIRWDPNKSAFTGGDSESYDKWSQALASAARLIGEAARGYQKLEGQQQGGRFLTAVIPVLVVSDKTLWIVDYEENGARRAPIPADETSLFVGREYEVSTQLAQRFNVSHLHICTRTGFVHFLDAITRPNGRLWELIFGQAVRTPIQ